METDGDLALLVVNTNPAAAITDQISVAGFQPAGPAQIWQYGKTEDTAQSQSATGASALTSTSTNLALSGATFSYSFPAYSMTVLDLKQAPAIAAPAVANVVVGSTAWTSSFLGYLAAQNSRNVGGYSIPVGSGAQLTTLPWGNIDQIKVTFNENVVVDQSDLLLSGVNTPSYNVAGGTFSYDPSTFTAAWTLPMPIGPDKLMLALNADGSDPIRDIAGNRLDGEWTNPTSTADAGTSAFPSGNGLAGGNFAFRFNVLPGDATQDGVVGPADLSKLLTSYGKSGMTWSQGDFTGDGVIGPADLSKLLTAYGKSLPSGEPAAGTFPAAVPLPVHEPATYPRPIFPAQPAMAAVLSGSQPQISPRLATYPRWQTPVAVSLPSSTSPAVITATTQSAALPKSAAVSDQTSPPVATSFDAADVADSLAAASAGKSRSSLAVLDTVLGETPDWGV